MRHNVILPYYYCHKLDSLKLCASVRIFDKPKQLKSTLLDLGIEPKTPYSATVLATSFYLLIYDLRLFCNNRVELCVYCLNMSKNIRDLRMISIVSDFKPDSGISSDSNSACDFSSMAKLKNENGKCCW